MTVWRHVKAGFGLKHVVDAFLHRLARYSLLERFAGTSFVVFVALGLTIAHVLVASVETAALQSAERSAYGAVYQRVIGHLSPRDLAGPPSAARQRAFRRFVGDAVLSDQTVRLRVWNNAGAVVRSDDVTLDGRTLPVTAALAAALNGRLTSRIPGVTQLENRDDRRFGRLLEVYIPIRFKPGGPVSGALDVYQRYDPVAAQIDGMQREVYGLLALGLFVLYVMLFGTVRSASQTIVRQQRELRRYTDHVEESYRQTIASLAAAVDARDSSTERHCSRVTEMAVELGRWIGLGETEIKDLERAALLHDVGKIGVSDAILLKPDRLDDEEWQAMRRHPEIGYNLLRNIRFLERTLPVVLYHHERWDGRGYPNRLSGVAIPLFARLFAVIDAYDAITSDRPYRAGASHEAAMEQLHQSAGSHFDPTMVAAFADMMEQRRKTAVQGQRTAGAVAHRSFAIPRPTSALLHEQAYSGGGSGAGN